MQINPGGRLDVADIVGRDVEVARFWSVLHRQGLILTGERRIGKSHIVLKMHHDGHPGFHTIYQELEAVRTTGELVRAIYTAVSDRLSGLRRLKASAIKAWHTLVPKRIGQLELPTAEENWKPLLTHAIDDVVHALQGSGLAVLIWDEFPLMVDNISKSEGPDKAMQLLDLLRSLRQTHGQELRFLFTGSIGLHLVLKSLRDAGHTNSPVNDMHAETVDRLARESSVDLACRLLETLRPVPERPRDLAEESFALVGGFPYYLHHVADQLQLLGRPATVADVRRAVDALILADNDPAHLAYYVQRIRTHYDPPVAGIAFPVLDAVAAAETGLGMPEIVNLVRHSRPEATDEQVRDACQLLRQDHYLTLTPGADESVYDFHWPFIKRWWRRNRL